MTARRKFFCTYHCRGCGSHFTSLAAFDAHRAGPYSNRVCSFPDDRPLVEHYGVCDVVPGDGPKRVVIYETPGAAQVRARFAARERATPER